MSYQVLALKYRPQTFSDVVGQTHVTTTLINAIQSNRVAHAILFTGPRGTGKTTIARILAKAMNCQTGPTPSPCNQCKICTDIIDGHCSDVFEIDGASNNSVDQVRDLRENVTYMPGTAKYKIYIIDEVHMLSTAAFNALLKTLEEPPEHVIFILATTEVHKIPATILSRCQRHDLGRINLPMISEHLQNLCRQEGFEVDQAGLDLIAQEADGSIRDSLSLLDRILSCSETKQISQEAVLDSLGILDTQVFHDVAVSVFNQNGARIIQLIEQVNDAGMDLKKFYSDLILYFRNLNVVKLCGKESPNINLSDTEKERLHQLADPIESPHINAVLQSLLNDESLVRYTACTKTAVETVLLKLIQVHPGARIDQIIGKLDHLARQVIAAPDPASTPEPPVKNTQMENMDQDYRLPPEPERFQTQEPPPEIQAVPVPSVPEAPIPQPGLQEPPVTYERNWQGFLKKIETKLPFMFTLLSKGQISETGTDQIMVKLENCSSFDKKRINSKKKALEEACLSFLNKHLTIEISAQNREISRNDTKKQEIKAKQAAMSHPFVVEAQKMFDGEIIN